MRDLAQITRLDGSYHMPWFERKVLRFISIYFTWTAFKLGLSANQISYLAASLGIGGSFWFLGAEPWSGLVGSLAFFLFLILDCTDGEIARLTQTTSPWGRFLEGWLHPIVLPLILFNWYWGLSEYYSLGHLKYLGFLVILFMIAKDDVLKYLSVHLNEFRSRATTPIPEPESSGASLCQSTNQLIFGYQGIFIGILLGFVLQIVGNDLIPFAKNAALAYAILLFLQKAFSLARAFRRAQIVIIDHEA